MFMLPGILLGAITGVGLARLVARRRHGWGHHHGGGCGHRRGFGRGFGGGFGPGRLFHLLHELELDRSQRREIWQLMAQLKQSAGALRFEKLRGLDELAGAFGKETFDRAHAEAAAAHAGEAVDKVKKDFLDALERVHAILRPDQRAHLADVLADFGFGNGGGPSAPPL